MSSKEYYTLLGINENASEIEIKEAFRTKAKIYHPDVCDDPDAADLFIRLTEAYQYAIQKNEFINRLRSHISQKESFENRWKAQQRKKAQEYARRHAKMKYEQFEKSRIYKSANFFFSIYDYIIFFLGIFIVISSAVGVYIKIKTDEFTADTVALAFVGIVLGSLFVIFTYKRFKFK